MKSEEQKIPKKITGVKRILRAFGFSRDGFGFMLKEDAFRQELLLLVVCFASLFFLDKLSLEMKALMLASIVSILVVETLNTAVERLADVVTEEFHPGIKEVKDMCSLAVLLSFIAAASVWGAGLFLNFK